MSVISREQWKAHFLSLAKANKQNYQGNYTIGTVTQSGSGVEPGDSPPPTIPSLKPPVQKVKTVRMRTGNKKRIIKKKPKKTTKTQKPRSTTHSGKRKQRVKTSKKKNY